MCNKTHIKHKTAPKGHIMNKQAEQTKEIIQEEVENKEKDRLQKIYNDQGFEGEIPAFFVPQNY